MKKLLLTLLTLTFCSCFGEIDLFNPQNVEKFKLTQLVSAPVTRDSISIAIFNGDTIYRGNVHTSIEVPKISTTSTRNVYSGLQWHFMPNETGNYFYQKIFKGIALFEDIPNGDCDYNDFVCKIGYQIDVDVTQDGYINYQNGNGLKLSITGIYPLAMGNTIPLSFGIEIVRTDNNSYLLDEILYDDIRRDAFRDESGFINTVTKNHDTRNANLSSVYNVMVPKKLEKNNIAINFYIVSNGKKHYMVNASKAGLTQNYTPWGLFIPISDGVYYNPSDIGFRYPKELLSIFDTYPNFRKWVNGETDNPFSEVVEENLFQW